MPELHGQCLCGAVAYAITAPSLWCAHCHCRMCQKAGGAGIITWFGVKPAQFRYTRGEDQVHWYASSPQAERGFCQTCCSPLFFRSERWPDELHITRASLDDPLDREPAAHVFFDTHVRWMPIDTELPRKGGESGVEPLPKPYR